MYAPGAAEHAAREGARGGADAARAGRAALAAELAPLALGEGDPHPWIPRDADGAPIRMPGGESRWSRGRSLDWVPLAPDRVAEVAYDHLQGDRFRHATSFIRWRVDRQPDGCRYDQLEVTPARELGEVLRPILNRLIVEEGYAWENGRLIKPKVIEA